MIIAECTKKEHLLWALSKTDVCLVIPYKFGFENFLLNFMKEILSENGIGDICDSIITFPEILSDITKFNNISDFGLEIFIFRKGCFYYRYKLQTLNDSIEQLRYLISQAKKENEFKDPYKVLGISPNATESEIREARDKKIKKCHPDKIEPLNLDPAFLELANKMTKEINDAYKFLIDKLTSKK